jgi:acyl-CoA synthetase (AMP-forming)/AMP-acid ligase II
MSKRFPNKKSVVFGDSYYTFKDFEERSNQMANFFTEVGIKKGTRTLLFVTPRLDFSILTFALFKMGAIPVLIDPGMGIKNLLHSIKQVRPEALVSIGKVHWIRRLFRAAFQSVKIKVSLDPVGGRTHDLYKKLEDFDKNFEAVSVLPDDPSAILFTSGGTGIPKGVLYTHGIMNAQTEALQKMFSLSEKETDLPGFPLFALFTLAMGMTSVIPDMDPTKPAQCDPKKLVHNILKYQVTFVAGSPAIWERVGRFCLKNNIQLPCVKFVVMFGAPVQLEIHRMFKKILTTGDTYTPYGATECLPVSLISGSEVLNSKSEQGFGTCVGRAVPGVEIKIINVSDIPKNVLNELGKNTRGEIVVSGTQVTPLYFDMPNETAKAKILDKGVLWHRMGDLGYLDQENRLWFLGRKSHLVQTEKDLFYPLEVEAPFNRHPLISRVALVKLNSQNEIRPGLVIERFDGETRGTEEFFHEVRDLSLKGSASENIHDYFLHPGFPVDVRHNIKVDQLKLGSWASKRKGFHV